jgi:hypothetical protein
VGSEVCRLLEFGLRMPVESYFRIAVVKTETKFASCCVQGLLSETWLFSLVLTQPATCTVSPNNVPAPGVS